MVVSSAFVERHGCETFRISPVATVQASSKPSITYGPKCLVGDLKWYSIVGKNCIVVNKNVIVLNPYVLQNVSQPYSYCSVHRLAFDKPDSCWISWWLPLFWRLNVPIVPLLPDILIDVWHNFRLKRLFVGQFFSDMCTIYDSWSYQMLYIEIIIIMK